MARLNLKVIVVTFEESGLAPAQADEASERSLDYYLDEERNLYRYFGMQSARFRDLWGVKTVWTYLRLLSKGRKMQKSTGDIYQRGGDVLLDPEGTVRFHHVADGPGDRKGSKIVMAVVEKSS